MSKEKHNIKTTINQLENLEWYLQDAYDSISVYSDNKNKDSSVVVNPSLKKIPQNTIEIEIWHLYEQLNSFGKQIDYVRRSLSTNTLWNGMLMLVIVLLVANDFSDFIVDKDDKKKA